MMVVRTIVILLSMSLEMTPPALIHAIEMKPMLTQLELYILLIGTGTSVTKLTILHAYTSKIQ